MHNQNISRYFFWVDGKVIYLVIIQKSLDFKPTTHIFSSYSLGLVDRGKCWKHLLFHAKYTKGLGEPIYGDFSLWFSIRRSELPIGFSGISFRNIFLEVQLNWIYVGSASCKNWENHHTCRIRYFRIRSNPNSFIIGSDRQLFLLFVIQWFLS